jgi:hypothetical protein
VKTSNLTFTHRVGSIGIIIIMESVL